MTERCLSNLFRPRLAAEAVNKSCWWWWWWTAWMILGAVVQHQYPSLLVWLSRQLEFRQRREAENSRSCCWEQLWTPIKPWLVLWWSVSAAALWHQSRSGRVWLLVGIYFKGSNTLNLDPTLKQSFLLKRTRHKIVYHHLIVRILGW